MRVRAIGWACASPDRTPTRFGGFAMTFHVARTGLRPRWPSAGLVPDLPPRTHHPFASFGSVVARLRLRLGVPARDRPADPNQSAGKGTTGGPVTSGPIRRLS
jgi:hypothetical protein